MSQTDRSTDQAREDDHWAHIRERWANNFCPDCKGACYATTAYDDVRWLSDRLRVVLKEHDEALQENHNELESEIDAMDSRRASERERAEKAEADLLRAEEALQAIEKARPTKGVPIKDTLEGCNHIARTYFAARGGGK